MGNVSENSVYVNMMLDALRRKEKILSELYEITREQEKMLKQEELDEEAFLSTLDRKGVQIDDLNEIDEGFDALFKKVEREVQLHKEAYKDSILEMQKLIRSASEKGMQIQALEAQNSEHLKVFLASQRKKVREFHVNNKMASNYYQNMANIHKPDQSYYFNETK